MLIWFWVKGRNKMKWLSVAKNKCSFIFENFLRNVLANDVTGLCANEGAYLPRSFHGSVFIAAMKCVVPHWQLVLSEAEVSHSSIVLILYIKKLHQSKFGLLTPKLLSIFSKSLPLLAALFLFINPTPPPHDINPSPRS
jgi:hypothetical protein